MHFQVPESNTFQHLERIIETGYNWFRAEGVKCTFIYLYSILYEYENCETYFLSTSR